MIIALIVFLALFLLSCLVLAYLVLKYMIIENDMDIDYFYIVALIVLMGLISADIIYYLRITFQ